ncbi:hypothetical protein L2E82_06006 [Cichorium intybus]|uniref:Uncharacterized protein n=1 Tax=Cichorium intybus TaxID=13427 RepID=A0ACB9H9Y3_CICIN|nr:hypothetical protein L2E82_06006 [Cichorium intybus]
MSFRRDGKDLIWPDYRAHYVKVRITEGCIEGKSSVVDGMKLYEESTQYLGVRNMVSMLRCPKSEKKVDVHPWTSFLTIKFGAKLQKNTDGVVEDTDFSAALQSAESKLKSVVDRHWSDGALEADLRRADYIAKPRAMEDALMALETNDDICSIDCKVEVLDNLKSSLACFGSAQTIIVSVDYRRAPEYLYPAQYDDSWEAIKWVASHATRDGTEPWLNDYADFERVFFGGESACANIAHHMGMRIGLGKDLDTFGDGFKLVGLY